MANIFFQEDFLFDSHSHLSDKQFDADRESCITRVTEAGVRLVLDIGVDVASSNSAIESALRFPDIVRAAVGIDPDVFTLESEIYIENMDMEAEMRKISDMIENNPEQISAIGESGMDDYWSAKSLAEGKLTLSQYNQIRENQEKLFEMHLVLSEDTGLPVSIHSRGAEQRCIDIVKAFPKAKGVFHSFTGSYELAKQIVDAGWGLGMSGIITFKNAEDIRQMYKRILGPVTPDWTIADLYKHSVYLETDSPFLAPEGKRGQRNEPANVADIWQFLMSNFI